MYLGLLGLGLNIAAIQQPTLETADKIFYFVIGFIVAATIFLIILLVHAGIQKKRALAFTKRFAILSEALSSFKAVAYQITIQLRKTRSQLHINEMTKNDAKKLVNCVDGLTYIFDNLSAGMVPPTEEIAMSALTGKKTSLEQRAYEDSLKFRDEIRQLRHTIEQKGLDGLANIKKTDNTKLN